MDNSTGLIADNITTIVYNNSVIGLAENSSLIGISDNITVLSDNSSASSFVDNTIINVAPVSSTLAFEPALTNFTFDLYGAIDKSGNEILSPFSITAALLFLMLGTDGTTNRQMKSTMFRDEDAYNVHESYRDLSDILIRRTTNGLTLSVANRLFGNWDFNVLSNFTDDAMMYYGSELELVDFSKQTEKSRQRINSWIATNTNNKIQDLIPKGSLNSQTVMVLANAIYFKGHWEDAFDPKETRKRNFFVKPNVQRQVDMMYRKGDAKVGIHLGHDCKILELPYSGGNVSMVFVLPMDANGLPQLETKLTSETLTELLSTLKTKESIINIPKFSITENYQLGQMLSSLGMTELFDSVSADFTNLITPPPKVVVSEIRHKAFIEVSEEGTEAAAATSIQISLTSLGPPPFEFNAEHPFLFMIREKESGTILFMGRLADP